MEQLDQEPNAPPTPLATADARGAAMSPATFKAVALLVVGLSVVSLGAAAGLVAGRFLRPEATPPKDASAQDNLNELFKGWGTPDLALVLSGEQHGYLLPCGCSRPQKGGLERRYNFMQGLRDRGWPVAAVDLGDVPQLAGLQRDMPQNGGPPNLPNLQGLAKYVLSMQALKKMDYTAVGIGKYERQMPLSVALDNFALNEHSPRVLCANLLNKDDFPDEVGDAEVVSPRGSNLKVYVTGIVSRDLFTGCNDENKVKFNDNGEVLKKLVKTPDAQQADVRVLLYQGSVDKARMVAKDFPQFQVILCLTNGDEPPAKPDMQGDTMIVTVGHKGKYVGVVGVFAGLKPGSLKFRYQMVEMTENYETPKGQEKANPILGLMEDYTAKLKKDNVLKQYPQTPHPLQVQYPDADYVGTDKCISCHTPAYNVWKDTPHAHAYKTLVDAKRPSLRQYDGECIVCHTIGFGYKTGFTDQANKNFDKLIDVGCESCHGPGGKHLDNPNNEQVQHAMNPWKLPGPVGAAAQKQHLLQIGQFCQSCHDLENDVHWNIDKWKKIEHYTPPPPPKKNK